MTDKTDTIWITVPKTPIGLPEQYASFPVCFGFWVDIEKRLASPISRQCVAIRVLNAIEEGKESGRIGLRPSDHALICELLNDSETPFMPPLSTQDKETGEQKPFEMPPFVERGYLRAILNAKADEPVKAEPATESANETAQAAE
jgi:hypothetical protein